MNTKKKGGGLKNLLRLGRRKSGVKDPLRLGKSNSKVGLFRSVSKKRVTQGSAEDILGVMVNPKPWYMTTEEGECKAATFISSDNNIVATQQEISELAIQLSKLKPEKAKSKEEKEDILREQEEVRSRIKSQRKRVSASTRAIAYHDKKPPYPLIDAIQLRGTFLLRSFQRDVKPFTDRLNEVRHWGNRSYTDFLDKHAYHVLGTNDPTEDLKGRTLRDLVYWSRAGAIVPVENKEKTASLHGKVVTEDEAAYFLFETNERHPYSVVNRRPLKFRTYSGNLLNFACPNRPYFQDDHYIINKRGYMIYGWPLQVDELLIRRILELDVDFLVSYELSESVDKLFATVLLRSSSEIDSAGGFPKLEQITRQLRRFNATPLRGADLRHAFQAFVPGSDILHPSVRLRLHSGISRTPTNNFLEIIKEGINAGESTSKGDFFIGFREGNKNAPIYINAAALLATTAFIGQQQAGKTETATKIFALPRTPNCLVVHWSTAHGESWPQLARMLDGHVVPIDLDDVSTKEYPNLEDRMKAQLKIHEEAAELAKSMVAKLRDGWISSKTTTGLPLVIRPVKDTTAYVVFADTFLNEFSLAWEECFIPDHVLETENQVELANELLLKTKKVKPVDEMDEWISLTIDDPRLCVVFLDDISNLDEEGMDANIGHLKRDAQQSARETINKALWNYRKRRQALIVTLHSYEHLRKFYPVDAFSSIMTIGLTSQEGPKVGKLHDPQGANELDKMVVREDNIDLRLPPYLLNYGKPLHGDWS